MNNSNLFKMINRLSGRYDFVDNIMILVSNRIRFVFIFVLIFMWFKNEMDRKVTYRAGLSAGLTLLINIIIKLFYYKPRPFVRNKVGILIPSKKDSSLPSKHTILVFAISTTILLYRRVLGTILMGLSLITGFSRIWVGHHYPSDIIVSAIIGCATSVIVDNVSRITNYFNKNNKYGRYN